MESNGFQLSVLVGGQTQPEQATGEIILPFGTEYALRFYNSNDRRAVVKFLLDGENVSGSGYVLPAYQTVEIERHSEIAKKFKFVDLKSREAKAAGKSGKNEKGIKGLIEARFQFEQEIEMPRIVEEHHYHHYPPYHRPFYPPPRPLFDRRRVMATASRGMRASMSATRSQPRPGEVGEAMASMDFATSDGCTVRGASSSQSFGLTHVELEAATTIIKLFIRGFVAKAKAARRAG